MLARGSVVVTSSARRLIDLSKGGEKVETIAVIGSEADPASHPDLREITENLRILRTKWFPRAKLALFTPRDICSLSMLALSSVAFTNLPGRYWRYSTTPLVGYLFTCTLNTFMKMETRVALPLRKSGSSTSTMLTTLPSAGETKAESSSGNTRGGSRKNCTANRASSQTDPAAHTSQPCSFSALARPLNAARNFPRR